MTSLAMNVFKGMLPRRSRQQLPPEGAELAVNCEMLSGDLRALRGAIQRKTLTSQERIRSAFRVPASFRDDVADPPPASLYSDDDVWHTSTSDFAHFVKGPLLNDKYHRFYWTEPGQRPKYAALADLVTGGPNNGVDPYYILGTPAPKHTEPDPDAEPPVVGDMFTVTASDGTEDLKETRCYVYTFINIYGEESAPSPPVCAEGNGDGTWTLAGLKTAYEEPWASEGAPLEKVRIYRTITGETGGSFFFVDELQPPAASFVDDIPTDEISLNAQLESDSWATPPENLIGLIVHPNGFLVGFEENGDLYFSVPYRPHAWPAEFALSTQGAIQALGVFGQSIAALTNAHPYVATGANPLAMTLIKSDTSAPCVSRNSVVSFEEAVLYASPNGITSVGYGGLSLISEALVTEGEWWDRYDPPYLHATRDGNRYLGVAIREDETLERQGLLFAPREAASVWTEVDLRLQHEIETLQTDLYNGDVLSVVNNVVNSINYPLAFPLNYQWKSLEFVTARPCNFGAYRIDFDRLIRYPEQAPESDSIEQFITYNRQRITTPLDTLNHHPIAGVRDWDTYTSPLELEQIKQPVGGSPLIDVLALGRATVTVNLYGNRLLRYSKTLTEPGIYRLPEGYKTDLWQLEFTGNADLHHFKMAETGKELARV